MHSVNYSRNGSSPEEDKSIMVSFSVAFCKKQSMSPLSLVHRVCHNSIYGKSENGSIFNFTCDTNIVLIISECPEECGFVIVILTNSGRIEFSLNVLCPLSSSSAPEAQALQSSRDGGSHYSSKEESGEAVVPGYYTTNSYQYQDTEL